MATVRKSDQPDGAPARRPARKAAARKAPAKSRPSRTSSNGQAPPSLRSVAISAAAELAGLIGHDVEGIVAAEKTDDGWRVELDVVESRRIPETTDILATYEVDVDRDGAMTGYRRLKRYVRGRFQE
ncbi:gas vesicle protein [Kribbella pittospori]|uniref:Gas vesicle protein n=1 Tax=Kribbella pittospori TaxID=722689 RepID=A0A4R0K4H5_9ACTN|nr:gas vesicle protein [Kribbella pittospori]TCC54953.1 gas vesicle protein [Kribbella pittospori]